MAISIGKRKRQQHEEKAKGSIENEEFKHRRIGRDEREESNHELEDEAEMRARFQRAFEAKFKPLERSQTVSKHSRLEESEQDIEPDSDSDWSGLSVDEDLVQTIRYDIASPDGHDIQRHEKKAFMVCTELVMSKVMYLMK